jgi:apolipoprotein N-acyltransferase
MNPKKDTNLAWLGFWMFLSVYVASEAWLYSQGHETFFWQHQTDAEKQIQQKAVECQK